MSQPETAVIILAAGAGTRMKSAIPKMLHEVVGRSMLGHALHAAAGITPQHLIAVVGHGREQVIPAIESTDLSSYGVSEVRTAIQEEQHGTGHAVGCGLEQTPK